jgi:hypothetical protein
VPRDPDLSVRIQPVNGGIASFLSGKKMRVLAKRPIFPEAQIPAMLANIACSALLAVGGKSCQDRGWRTWSSLERAKTSDFTKQLAAPGRQIELYIYFAGQIISGMAKRCS